MTICSLVLHTRPENIEHVSAQLNGMLGVEVYGKDDDGKLIVVLDHPERTHCSESIMAMASMDKVISTSLVYESAESY